MVSRRTIARILLEGTGEFMIILSALIYSLQYPGIPSIQSILLLLLGVGLRLYGDEIYTAIRKGNLKERLCRLDKNS